MEVGAAIRVRLRDGQPLHGRRWSPPGRTRSWCSRGRAWRCRCERVAYDAIVSIARERKGGVITAGKAAAIGVAAGAGAFLGILVIAGHASARE